MIVDTICCEKEMIELNMSYNSMDMNINTLHYFICGNCGRILYLNEEETDDENLDNLLETYEEELKDTKIYKEMKNEKS